MADVDLGAEPGLARPGWPTGFHGAHGATWRAHGMRARAPAELVPGTARVITARMDYLPSQHAEGWQAIEFERLDAAAARRVVSVYARGPRLSQGAARSACSKLADRHGRGRSAPFDHRVFTDSAPGAARSSWRSAAAQAGAASTRWC